MFVHQKPQVAPAGPRASMHCVVAGAGYVGVTTGLVLAERGHSVVLVDIDEARAERLAAGEVPFHEPGVEAALKSALATGRVTTGTDLAAAVASADAVLVCVGTPQRPNGDADLSFVAAAAKTIGQGLRRSSRAPVVIVKSTVPPGTAVGVVAGGVAKASRKKEGEGFHIASNPEFLREGSALADARKPDRVVAGALRSEAVRKVAELWGYPESLPLVETSPSAAELMKYASNAFLAMKVSFANETANVAERLGVDVYDVMRGVGLDARIGAEFLRAGAGFGGSCFPKDVRALERFAKRIGAPLRLPKAVLEINENQPRELLRIVEGALGGSVRGKSVALLGLAFKPDTDDVRESRAIPLYRALVKAGASVACWDPLALENFRRAVVAKVDGSQDLAAVLKGKDAAVIQTEWAALRDLAPAEWRRLMRGDAIVDGRRSVDPSAMAAAGLRYFAIGRKNPA